ncbi:MAG TPA: sugar ABC transporter ATP-binding protein [Anaeromyxobacter sp.]|nr:sugar ABC transporter ATP-binding protein [Anaeromyxobacter sp.]
MKEILRLEHVSKSFVGVKAMQDISFDLRAGEVHCLCGENGAGKSTLIKVLSGAHQPDEGSIYFEGQQVTLTPHLALGLGIQTIYQEHIVFDSLSVMENIFMGLEVARGGFLDRSEMRRQTVEVLQYLQADIGPETNMGRLSSGQQKTVEIAKGLVFKRKAIILDEPTASFSAAEIDNLLEIIKTVRASGIGIIYISHHLDEVFRIADRVTVLRDGRKVSHYEIQGLTKTQLIKDMVGRDPSTFYRREAVNIGEVVFEAHHVSGNGVRDVSFELRRGEVLGFAGMTGSGRSELMEVLFGSARLDGGQIRIRGKEVRHASPKASIRNRMCFITEDRQNTGLFLEQTIASNVMVANMVNTRDFFASPAEDVKVGDGFIQKLLIKARDAKVRVMNLSGGNQQKVVLAKWFNTSGEVFIFDEPTRGIDVNSKQEIYQLMVGLLKQGHAIIMVSSDMPEVISMSDRVAVMKDGEMVGLLGKEQITEENILTHSIGDKAV